MVIGQSGIFQAQLGIPDQGFQGLAQALGIIAAKENSCSLPQLAEGRNIAGHNRAARERGLQRRKPKGLIARGGGIDGCSSKKLDQLFLVPMRLKMYAMPRVFYVQSRSLRF